jgi:hypothetical protein
VDFVAVMDQVIALLHQRSRLTYRTLQRQFQLDEVALEDLKEELIYGQRLRVPWNSWPTVTRKRLTRASIRSWNT